MATVVHEIALGLYIGAIGRKPRRDFEDTPDEIDPVALMTLEMKSITALICAGGRSVLAGDFETSDYTMPNSEIMDTEVKRVVDKLERAAARIKTLIDAGHNVLVYGDDYRQQSALVATFYLIRVHKQQPDAVIRQMETCMYTPADHAAAGQYLRSRSLLAAGYENIPAPAPKPADPALVADWQRAFDATAAKKKAIDDSIADLEAARAARERKKCLCRNSFKKLLRDIRN